MNIESYRNYCLQKKGVTEGFPFDEQTLVFKVLGKMFAVCGLDRIPLGINLKCDPDRAISLREEYDGAVKAAWHMNKVHWNTCILEDLPANLIMELTDHSYDLVVAKMTKKLRETLENL